MEATEAPKRKGAKSISTIPEDVRHQLNSGQIESANLVEWLAVDQRALLAHVMAQLGRAAYLQPVLAGVEALAKPTVNSMNEAIGVGLLAQAAHHHDAELLPLLAAHRSDVVRCWAAYTVGRNSALSIAAVLHGIQGLAADNHFGVREIAWLAVRPAIAAHVPESIAILTAWTASPDPNLRRFASEATRPRGVWCAHLEVLKQQPALGLGILEPLKTDPSRYVQDSVGNWLNDASKTQAAFVAGLCQRWKAESPTEETDYIVKKALRTIAK